jgi:hypothetical protein
MIEMLKRHEIQVLRRAGHTWKEVAALSSVSVRTVRRVAAEAAVTTVDNAAERVRRLKRTSGLALALAGSLRRVGETRSVVASNSTTVPPRPLHLCQRRHGSAIANVTGERAGLRSALRVKATASAGGAAPMRARRV